VTDALLDLPAHLRERLAAALESGLLTLPCPPAALASALGHREAAAGVGEGLAGLARLGVPGPAAAVWLRSLDRAAARIRRPELVWTGPEVPGLHARDTRRVYEELLGTARRSVWASTFVYFDGPRAFEALARRMDEQPDLAVTLLLNIQLKRGDTTAADHLVRRFADRFWAADWPGTRRPSVFYDPRALEPDGPTGVLHAKAVVADGEVVFLTSANLTEAALDRNIELGLLVRDRALAASVASHFQVLIERGLLLPLPES
jgi:phosphatidylserine/phosphatidylglycerophosphate/cardiolipin synthase-like enzyme